MVEVTQADMVAAEAQAALCSKCTKPSAAGEAL